MKYGWINVLGAVIVILMMVPNIIYAIRNKDEKNITKVFPSRIMPHTAFLGFMTGNSLCT